VVALARTSLGGDIGAAASALTVATAIAEELGLKPLAAHCELARAELYALQGDQTRARQQREQARRLLEQLQIGTWLPLSRT
jgi:hypothetical protein